MQIGRLLRRHGDLALAVALACGYTVELLRWPDSSPEVSVPLGVAACMALALRRRSPVIVFVIVTVLNAAADDLAGNDFNGHSVFFVAVFLLNLYSLGANARGVEAWLGGVGVVASIVISGASDGDLSPSGIFFYVMLSGLPWGAGVVVRLRVDRVAELAASNAELKQQAERAVIEERARIARELHDVVSHAIAVTVLQARGGRRMIGRDDDAVRRALDAIERTNTSALADMRRLLTLLREAGDGDGARDEPAPSLERLDALLEQVRASGLPVELQVSGDPPPVPPGLDLSAYRIVQEALTNVLKHGGPQARARVEVTYGPSDLRLAVTNRGRQAPAGDGGHGLAGIRERASVAGGEVDAGPEGDGFAVRARLPYLTEAT